VRCRNIGNADSALLRVYLEGFKLVGQRWYEERREIRILEAAGERVRGEYRVRGELRAIVVAW
jgi:hypothetical protein